MDAELAVELLLVIRSPAMGHAVLAADVSAVDGVWMALALQVHV